MASSGSDVTPHPPRVLDARLVPAALTAWTGAWLGTAGAPSAQPAAGWSSWPTVWALVGLVAVLTSGLVWWVSRGPVRWGGPLARLVLVACLVGAAALLAGQGRVAAQASGPVVELAAQRATVDVHVRVRSDPLPRSLPPGAPAWQRDQVRVSVSVLRVAPAQEPRAPPLATSTPAVVLAPSGWRSLRVGEVVSTSGRLGLPRSPGPAAAVLLVGDEPQVIAYQPALLSVGDGPRRALRAAVDGYDEARAGLLPSLVVGDESLLAPATRESLRVTGLAHLTAVSGANVAIVLGAVLVSARWSGVRGAWLVGSGLVAIVVFALLARPEPSVVRASAMGVVVVLGLVGGRPRTGGRGVGPLALAVAVLLMADPWLSRSIGFALSCAATAGIVLLARGWAGHASRWMPRPVAAALSVPLAAQLACTPLLVAMAGELSLSALPANVLAAPAVPVATVLGLVAALVGVVAPAVAHLLAGLAMVPTGWIVLVAERAADLPGTSMTWGWGVPVALLGSLTLIAAVPAILRSPVASTATCLALAALLLLPGSGWPPAGWSLVACEVGQGDALVLRASRGEAIVVDTGPDPVPLAACLDDLGVEHVPLLVITHFHADHSGGLAALGADRTVGSVLVTLLDEPAEQAAALRAWAQPAGVPVRRAREGQSGRAGAVTWRVLWPQRVIRGVGSAPNQASVVLRAEVDGLSVLLTGDIEPAAQDALLASADADLDVDVLKVPHHGSAEQSPAFLAATDPALALVTVGEENSYGHPSALTLERLAGLGAVVARTDTDGAIAVQAPVTGASLGLVRRGTR